MLKIFGKKDITKLVKSSKDEDVSKVGRYIADLLRKVCTIEDLERLLKHSKGIQRGTLGRATIKKQSYELQVIDCYQVCKDLIRGN